MSSTARGALSQCFLTCIFSPLVKDQSRCIWWVEARSHAHTSCKGDWESELGAFLTSVMTDVCVSHQKPVRWITAPWEWGLDAWQPEGITDACYTWEIARQAALAPHNLLLHPYEHKMLLSPYTAIIRSLARIAVLCGSSVFCGRWMVSAEILSHAWLLFKKEDKRKF